MKHKNFNTGKINRKTWNVTQDHNTRKMNFTRFAMPYFGAQYYDTIFVECKGHNLECRGIAESTLMVTYEHQTV